MLILLIYNIVQSLISVVRIATVVRGCYLLRRRALWNLAISFNPNGWLLEHLLLIAAFDGVVTEVKTSYILGIVLVVI